MCRLDNTTLYHYLPSILVSDSFVQGPKTDHPTSSSKRVLRLVLSKVGIQERRARQGSTSGNSASPRPQAALSRRDLCEETRVDRCVRLPETSIRLYAVRSFTLLLSWRCWRSSGFLVAQALVARATRAIRLRRRRCKLTTYKSHQRVPLHLRSFGQRTSLPIPRSTMEPLLPTGPARRSIRQWSRATR